MSDDDPLTIREADIGDLPGVLALYAQPDFDDGVVLALHDAERTFAHFARYPDYGLFVAEKGGRIVGSFALLIMNNLGHLGAPSGIVEDVVVGPVSHSLGIGRTMMQFAIGRCREKRCYKVMLSTNARRERAHAFYEKLCFERHGYSFRLTLEEAPA